MPAGVEKAQVILPSEREVKVTRSFRAPRLLVYRAYTEPTLLQRWLLVNGEADALVTHRPPASSWNGAPALRSQSGR